MDNKDNNESSRTNDQLPQQETQIQPEDSKIDYLKEYESIDEAFPDENPEKVTKLKNLLKSIESNEELTQLKREIESKILVLENLISSNKEIDEMITKSEKDQQNYHYSSYNRYKKYDDEDGEEDETKPRLSKRFIDKLLCSDIRQYYRTHELNEILYLHFKGFKKIENLETFSNLKVLFLEGNSITKISGLTTLVNLTSLYLHENLIDKIEGLETLVNLYNLNLSDNCISTIENLGNLPQLSTVLLKRNRIGIHGLSDLKGLLELQANFTVLDISNNQIGENDIVNEVIARITNLRVLYMSGNECVRKIANYRKTLIALLKELRYIDDKPVFEDERRFAMAFHRGGYEEEKNERALYKKEIEEKELKRINDFREMMTKWKQEGDKEKENGDTNDDTTKQIEEEKKALSPEEREKQKMALLVKCKNKKNAIFTENEVERFPEVKKTEERKKEKKKVIESMPELEEVKPKLQRNPYATEKQIEEINKGKDNKEKKSDTEKDQSSKDKENQNFYKQLDELD